MNILIWVFIWYAAFAGYYLFLKKRNILYKNRPRVVVGWYAAMSLLGLIIFRAEIKWALMGNKPLFAMMGLLLVVVALVLWYHSLTKRDYVPFDVSRNVFLSKTAEIIFQQIMVWILFGILQGILLVINPVILFTLVFFIIHVPLMLVIPLKKAMFFVTASLLGGIIFAICLTYIPSGYLIALVIHIGFYAAVAGKKKIWGMDTFYVM